MLATVTGTPPSSVICCLLSSPVHCNPEGQQCVFLRVCKCVAVYLVPMLICHNGRHYQFIGFPLLCSLTANMTPSLQFPSAATGPNLSRSYQHSSQITIKLSGWRKHQHSCPHPDTYTYIYGHLQTLSHVLCQVRKTLSLCLFFTGNTLPSHKKKTNFTQEITSVLSSGKSFS